MCIIVGRRDQWNYCHLVLSRFVDLIGGRMKAVLLVFLVGSCLSCVWVALLTMKYITYNVGEFYFRVLKPFAYQGLGHDMNP